MEFFKDLWDFMRERKKFWLAPIIIVLLLLGGLILLAEGTAVAPFIYNFLTTRFGNCHLRPTSIDHRSSVDEIG